MGEPESDSRERVKPTLPGGFRDYLPAEMIVRNRMIATIRGVFERFGFDPLETPGMERRQVLTGNSSNFRMMIFDTRLGSPREEQASERTALRFDLTVPLARVVAANLGELRLPFRRYQIGNVWRGEKPQAGRFREFMQFDADIVGTATPVADAEIVALMVATMQALGIDRFQVRFNNRKILNGLAGYAGFDAALTSDVLRIIDKLPKIGRDAVLRELTKARAADDGGELEEGADLQESGYGLGLPTAVADRIGAFLDLRGTTDELLGGASELFSGVPVAQDGLRELRQITDALRAMRVPEACWGLDLSVARGLAYYTGPVFETYLLDLPEIGSVFSGGRYDDLVNRFMDGSIPCTGASVGVDRLFAALTKLGRITPAPTMVQALVTVMDQGHVNDYLTLASELRDAGVRTVMWVGEETNFKEQLAYGAAKEIPVLVLLGDNERKSSTVSVKDMRARKQVTVPRTEFVATVRGMLAGT